MRNFPKNSFAILSLVFLVVAFAAPVQGARQSRIVIILVPPVVTQPVVSNP